MDRLTESNLASLRASQPRSASHQTPRINSYLASLAQDPPFRPSDAKQSSPGAIPDLAPPGPLSAARAPSVSSAPSAPLSRGHSAGTSLKHNNHRKRVQPQPAASRKRTKRRAPKEYYSSDADSEQKHRLDQRKKRREDLKKMRSGPVNPDRAKDVLSQVPKAQTKKAGDRVQRIGSLGGEHHDDRREGYGGRAEHGAELRRRKLANVNKDRITVGAYESCQCRCKAN